MIARHAVFLGQCKWEHEQVDCREMN